MHHAPALSLNLPPDRGRHRGLRLLGTMAVTTPLVWLGWQAGPSGTPTASMLVMAALSATPALWLMTRQATPGVQQLAWHPRDGHWSLQTPSRPDTQATPLRLGQIDCLADTGHWMLLRHRSPGVRPVWLPVSQRDHALHWHALRCAVFSPGTVPPSSPPPTHADE